MKELYVADVAFFAEQGRKVIAEGDLEIGVFKVGDAFYAWENECPHQGGPVCQGKTMNWVTEEIDADGKSHGPRWVEDRMNIVCPWHGFEFDLRTGKHPGDDLAQLKGYKTKVQDGKVYVVVE